MYRINPFGNPDGARADINEVNEMFISNTPYAVDISMSPESLLNKRIIIGAKGSGKTLYLRKIQALLKDRAVNQQTGIYVDDKIEQNLNCTEKIIGFCDYFPENVLSEKWTQLWKITLWTTLSLKYLHDPLLQQYAKDDQKEQIKKLLSNEGMYFDVAIPTYDIFKIFLMYINTAYDVNKRLDSVTWINLKYLLERILKESPVIYIFLDSIDIEYEHAPMHWTICQKGLFYAVMEMLQDRIWGERFHVLMSMRNNVFASVLRSEHSTKFREESHIYFLNWNFSNIKFFIEEKVKKLNECYFINLHENSEKNLQAWLGINKLSENNIFDESILDYIARHTRFVPRDAIIICNKLSIMHRLIVDDSHICIPTIIKEYVKECSKDFGDELLTICAKNITANQLPNGAGRYEYAENFTSLDAYQEGSFHRLKAVLSTLKSSQVTYDDLIYIQRELDSQLETSSYILDVLWQNGAIGYMDNDNLVRYYTQKADVDQLLPKGKKLYVLRTCIVDALSIDTSTIEPEKPA